MGCITDDRTGLFLFLSLITLFTNFLSFCETREPAPGWNCRWRAQT